jgi:hypothetical protein
MTIDLQLDHRFDRTSKKHYVNDWNTVLHCHHYSSLFTELAICTSGMDGTKKLVQAGEKVFAAWLSQYYSNRKVSAIRDRIDIAEQYWKSMGMGLIEIVSSTETVGSATMEYSHLDAGWLSKFGAFNSPVNFFTQGFLAGAFSAIYDKPLGSYVVDESKSLVKGDAVSQFDIRLK